MNITEATAYAVEFVMEFYKIDHDTAVKYYHDEIDSIARIFQEKYKDF